VAETRVYAVSAGGRVGLPKAVRGGVAAVQHMLAMPHLLKRCHPLPAR